MKINLTKLTIRLTVCAAALLLSGRWCLAQTDCPDNGQVPNSGEITLATAYQPYPTGTPPPLQAYRYAPPAPYDPPYPTVLVVPPDIFHDEDITDGGEPHERQASYDLQQAGFLVFQVETRLAPPGKLPNQLSTDPGTAPEQTDDLKRQILSALNDSSTNGNIYLVGGSAGGCLALWCGLDPASTVSGWNESKRAHIKGVVSLSGPTDFCDWSPDSNIPSAKLTDFRNDLDEYVGLSDGTDCAHDSSNLLEHASPEWLVTNGATSNPPPIMLYTTAGDHVPYYQASDMYNALTTQFPSLHVEEWQMSYTYGSGYEHAFHYWHKTNDATGSDGDCVSQEVISFLETYH
jgi:acetyl esterase/lipase